MKTYARGVNVRRFVPALVAITLGALDATAFGVPSLAGIALVVSSGVGLEALARRSIREAALLAWLFGTAFLTLLLAWVFFSTAPHLGAWIVPFGVVACALEALPFALAGAAAAWFARRSWIAFVLGVAAIFALAETARTFGPYGLPLGTFGSSQTSYPFAGVIAAVGVPGTSFALVLIGALGATLSPRYRHAFAVPARAACATGIALLVAIGIADADLAYSTGAAQAVPQMARATASLRIGIVRDGPIDTGRGFAEGVRRYAAATRGLRDEHPRVVVWPEGVVFDTEPDAREQRATLRAAARDLGEPILTGATIRAGAARENVMLEQDPGGATRVLYIKRRPVPIGEASYAFGTGPSVVDAFGMRFGALICYEVAFDDLARDAANGGATALFAVENDTWFAGTRGPAMQLQMLQARSLESGLPALTVDSVGPTGVVAFARTEAVLHDRDGAWIVTLPAPLASTPYRAIGRTTVLAGLLGIALAAILAAIAVSARAHESAPKRA